MPAGFRSYIPRWLSGSTFPAPTDGTLVIAGVDRYAWLKHDTCSFRRAFNQRSTLSCILEDADNRGWYPIEGMNLIVLLGSIRLFGGLITRSREVRLYPSNVVQWHIEATDYNIIADKRVLYYDGLLNIIEFPAAYAGDTVKQIVATGLSDEGIDTSLVEDGPFIPSPITEFFPSVTAALNRITALTGYRWRIDEYKRLVFSTFASNPAPFNIAYPGNIPGSTWRDLNVERDMSLYRNEEFTRTESPIYSTKTETFIGDGVTESFFIGFIDPVSSNPTRWITNQGTTASGDAPIITVDGVAQIVGRIGIDGIGTGYDCTYTPDGIGINFLSAAGQTVPGVGQVISVTYVYAFSNVSSSSNAAEILARQAIEGGSGRWQRMNEQRNIGDGTTLGLIAAGDVDQYGAVAIRATYETDEQGIYPGQTQNLTLVAPSRPINQDLIVDAISTEWMNSTPFQFRHKVELTNIGPINQPAQIFEKAMEALRIGAPRNSAVRTDIAGSGGTPATFGGRQSDGSNGNYMQSDTILSTLDGANGPFTISLWIRVFNLADTSKVAFQYSDLTGSFQCRVDYGFTVAGQLAFFAANYSGSNPATGSGITLPDTDWHHICYRKNAVGSSGWDKFLDGVKTPISGAINFTLSGNMQYAFAFADRQNQFGGIRNLNGALAELAVWPTFALSDSQVAELAARTPANTVQSGGLEDYWPISGSISPEPNVGGSSIALTIHGSLPPA